ncbi:MAG: PilZ domain-containing protein [Nitrospirae bacterium]|nr:PilZ domain-containing protein [Nitrospirota bacterium]
MVYPQCPTCRKNFVRRSQRRGVIEHTISLVYIYPFRCQLCTRRFRAFQLGVRFERYTPDRREYVRIPIQVPVAFSWEQVQGQGTVVNLSMRDCAIETTARLHSGEVLCLRLDALNEYSRIVIEAAVVRSIVGNAVGLEVLRIQKTEREKLRQVIETLLGKT